MTDGRKHLLIPWHPPWAWDAFGAGDAPGAYVVSRVECSLLPMHQRWELRMLLILRLDCLCAACRGLPAHLHSRNVRQMRCMLVLCKPHNAPSRHHMFPWFTEIALCF